MFRLTNPRHLSKVLALCVAALVLAGPAVHAQVVRSCATMDNHQQQLAQNPQMAANMQAIETQTLLFLANGAIGADTVRRIPVVVHVLYNTPEQNISDQQILSQITVLNEDFRRTNPDAVGTLPIFQGVAADAEIEFCLATVNPQGGATNGITRTQTPVTQWGSNDAMKFTAQGGRDAWPRDQYLNIWVCNLGGGLLGYAQFPGGQASTDGVVVWYRSFGTTGAAQPPFGRGRTTTHEVGHWLNLRHIWGDNQPSCGNDFVSDTPAADGPHYGCQISVSSCGTQNMVQNYMDYSDDTCMNLFTQGQKARMQALFSPGGAREALLNSPAACGNVPPPPPPPAGGPYQVNQPASSLTLNGVAGTAATPAVVQVPAGTTVAASFGSDVAGRPWDTILSFAALVPAGGGAFATAGGQFINLGAAAPFLWLNSGGSSPLLAPFPGSFTTPATPQVPLTVSLQQFVVTPALADGYAISQGCQLVATAGAPSCPITLPAGPVGDDSSVTVTLTGSGGCTVPVPFYGTSYTQFHVSSNGRVVFQAPDSGYQPTITAARTGRPFAGFWTDLDPSTSGQIQISRPSASRFRAAWSGVRYWGENALNSFAIELDANSGAVILDGLLGIASNPETQSLDPGQNQFLGLSRGSGATLGGLSLFAPGGSGAAANATDMVFDFYDAAVNFGGNCPSLLSPVNRITFTPAANGNYAWQAN